MTPRFRIGDTISNGRVQYTVLDIETNQNGVLCYIFKNPIKDNNFRWIAEQVDEMFELISNTPNSFDWQSFRAEAAKDILANSIIPYALCEFSEESINIGYWTDRAVEWADCLISKLKEKEEK